MQGTEKRLALVFSTAIGLYLSEECIDWASLRRNAPSGGMVEERYAQHVIGSKVIMRHRDMGFVTFRSI